MILQNDYLSHFIIIVGESCSHFPFLSVFLPHSNFSFCLLPLLLSLSFKNPQMSWNGSDQLEKAMEEILDDDDEVKIEKSCVEKMEKNKEPENLVFEDHPAGFTRSLVFTPFILSESIKLFGSHKF